MHVIKLCMMWLLIRHGTLVSLMGAGAIIDWTVTPQHFETAADGYKKRSGKAVFCERGIQTAYWDTDTAAPNNKKNFSSIIVVFGSKFSSSLVIRGGLPSPFYY